MNKDKLLENVINELNSPTEKLLSIRKQLTEGVDTQGRPLETLEVTLDEEVISVLNRLIVEYNTTFEELCWLILENIIEGDIAQ